jgi:hypothetical protein
MAIRHRFYKSIINSIDLAGSMREYIHSAVHRYAKTLKIGRVSKDKLAMPMAFRKRSSGNVHRHVNNVIRRVVGADEKLHYV